MLLCKDLKYIGTMDVNVIYPTLTLNYLNTDELFYLDWGGSLQLVDNCVLHSLLVSAV